VSTYYSRTVYLAQRAIGAGDERPIIGVVDVHQQQSWTGAQTQQIITSTTGTPPGGMAKGDNIISDIKEKTSLRHRPELGGIIGSSSRKHRCS